MDDVKAKELLEKRIQKAEELAKKWADELNKAVLRGDPECSLAKLLR